MTSPANPRPATYTTIPISGADVVSRSFQNVLITLSRYRPLPEFLASFDLPGSFSATVIRIRQNSIYFRVNYAFIVSAIAAFALIGTPLSLLITALIFAFWLVLFFCREDPLVLWGYHISDRAVLLVLIVGSGLGLWIMKVLENLVIGVCVGLAICAIHGALRNPEGLFLDEDEAVSTGLIGSSSGSTSRPAFAK